MRGPVSAGPLYYSVSVAQMTAESQVARAEEEGWHFDGSMTSEGEVCDFIHALCLIHKPEVFVETGTFTGFTTKTISAAMERNGKGHLWTVENDPDLCRHYAETELPRTTFVAADSAEWCHSPACPEKVDIGFVDSGNPDVRLEDAKGLWPRIPEGGLLLCHDVEWYACHDYYPHLKKLFGPASLYLPALNGLGVWQR